MIVFVFGYRKYPRLDLVERFIDSLDHDTEVITGWDPDSIRERTTNDVDRVAILRARARGLPTRTFPADWKTHGKAAGMLRNTTMVEQLGPGDQAVGFDHALARGTKDSIRKSRLANRLSLVIDEHGKVTYTTGYWEARKKEKSSGNA